MRRSAHVDCLCVCGNTDCVFEAAFSEAWSCVFQMHFSSPGNAFFEMRSCVSKVCFWRVFHAGAPTHRFSLPQPSLSHPLRPGPGRQTCQTLASPGRTPQHPLSTPTSSWPMRPRRAWAAPSIDLPTRHHLQCAERSQCWALALPYRR